MSICILQNRLGNLLASRGFLIKMISILRLKETISHNKVLLKIKRIEIEIKA
jgi:hypothetical protein